MALLLKFLDAREMLSVKVHPANTHTCPLPVGETGKTEGWIVLEAGTKSRTYAGLVRCSTNLSHSSSLPSAARHPLVTLAKVQRS
jgi:mannose-6-phosphate isomerase